MEQNGARSESWNAIRINGSPHRHGSEHPTAFHSDSTPMRPMIHPWSQSPWAVSRRVLQTSPPPNQSPKLLESTAVLPFSAIMPCRFGSSFTAGMIMPNIGAGLRFVGGGGVFSMVEPALLGWDAPKRAFSIPGRPPTSPSPWSAAVSPRDDPTRTRRAAGRDNEGLGEQFA
jgi:hypothetical protein